MSWIYILYYAGFLFFDEMADEAKTNNDVISYWLFLIIKALIFYYAIKRAYHEGKEVYR